MDTLNEVPQSEPKKQVGHYTDPTGDVHVADVERSIIDINISAIVRKFGGILRTKRGRKAHMEIVK